MDREQALAIKRHCAMMVPLVEGLPWQQATKIRELVAALLAEGRVTMPELEELGEIWGGYAPDEVMTYEERLFYFMLCLTDRTAEESAVCERSWIALGAASPEVTVAGLRRLALMEMMVEYALPTG